MKKQKINSEESDVLRQKAAELLPDKGKVRLVSTPASEHEMLKMISELERYQIELEMQNEELVVAKEKAELAEEKYAELYDFAPYGYLSLSEKGEILQLNFAAASILGKERTTLINKRFDYFVSTDTQATFNYFFKNVFATKLKQTCELTIATKGNLPVYVRIDGVISQNNDLCLLTLNDITESILAKKELQGTEEKYRSSEFDLKKAQRISHLGNWELNIKTNELVWSEEIYRIFDCEPHEFKATYEAFLGFIHPEDREIVNEAYVQSLKEKTEYHIEHRIVTKNNQIKYVREKCTSTFDEQGNPLNSFGIVIDISEQKALEFELAESAERYKSLHNASFGGIAIHDKGIILECNKGLSEMTGYSLEELIGMDGMLLIVPEHRELVMDKIVTGSEKPYEANGLRKNGEQFPMRLEARNVPYKGKNIRTVEFRDITESKNAEKALRRSEAKLSALFTSMSEMVVLHELVFDEEGKPVNYRITDCNDAFTKITGISRDSAVGKLATELYGVAVPPYFNEFKEVAITGKPYNSETYYEPMDKHLNISVICPEKNHFATITTNITERKQAEDALRESEKEYRNLIEFSPVAMAIIHDWKTVYFNPAAVELFGAKKQDELLGKHIYELIHPDFHELAIDNAKLLAENGYVVMQEQKYIKLDGTILDVETQAKSIRFNDNVATLVVMNDITERKQAEQLIQNKSEEIAAQNEELNLANLELFAAKEMAEKSEERYRGLLTNLETGVVVHAIDTSIVLSNSRASELLGLSEDQMKGKVAIDSAWQFIYENYKPLPVSDYPVIRVLNSKKPIKNQVLGVCQKNKDITWLLVNGFPVFNNKNEILEIIISFIDITERKQAELLIQDKSEEIAAQNEELNLANIELITARKKAEESEIKFRTLSENSPAIIYRILLKPSFKFEYVSPAVTEITGYTPEDHYADPYLGYKLVHPDDRIILENAAHKTQGEPIILRWIKKDGKIIWTEQRNVLIFDTEGNPFAIEGIATDITIQKEAEQELKRIEWLLTSKAKVFETKEQAYIPPYGDLVDINTSRLILDSVGEQTLTDIVGDYLNLLDTSAAVYEKNGDYALGIFSSGWCRFMDAASRKACGTDDNRTALDCGKWHCHESCWSNASKSAIESGHPADIECNGGIRLYAVPIRVSDEIVGAINFGYGDPPRDERKLRELATLYQVSYDELRTHALNYESRPPYIVDLAKNRLQSSARLIGEIIERKQAELLIQNKSEEIAAQNEELNLANIELIAAKEKAEESEERYRGLLTNLETGVVVHAIDTSIILSNSRSSELLGLSEDQMKGKVAIDSAWQFIYENYKPLPVSDYPVIRVLNSKKPIKNQVLGVCQKNKDITWLLVNGFPVFNTNDEILEIVISFIDITERKKAELLIQDKSEEIAAQNEELNLANIELIAAKKKAEESEARFRNLMESIDTVSAQSYSPEGITQFWNKASENLYGYTQQEAIGRNLLDLIIPSEMKDVVINAIKEMSETGKAIPSGELVLKHKDGSPISVISHHAVVKVPGHEPELFCLDIDISQRKMLENEVKESEERFNLAMKASNDGLFDWNLETNEIYYSPGWKKMLGYADHELPNDFSVWEKTTAPEDVKKSWELQQKLITKQIDRFVMEFKMKHKDGHWVDILARSEAIFNESGKAVRMVGTHTNISETKQAEMIAIKERAISDSIIESIPGAFYMLDENGRYVRWNAYQRDVIVGKPDSMVPDINAIDTIHPDDRESVGSRIANVLRDGIAETVEGRVLLHGGPEYKWMLMTGRRVVIEEKPYLLGIGMDITERKLAEEKLMKSEERYALGLEASEQGIWDWNVETNEVFYSAQWKKQIGYNDDELKSEFNSWVDHLHPDEKDYCQNAVENYLKKPAEHFILDFRFRHKDGTYRLIHNKAASIKNHEGKVIRLFGTHTDITDSKLNEAIFKDIIEKNPMSIQILDMEGYPLQVNPAHTKLFGVEPPANYSIFKDEQLLSLGFGELFEHIKNGKVVFFPDTYYNVHDVDPSFPDSPVWVKALGFSLNDIGGNPNRIVLMHENITERKNAESLLNDIIENNPLSIQVADNKGHTLRVNPAFVELFGAVPPQDFSIFDDLMRKSNELATLVSRAKKGEIVHLPDTYFNAHDAVELAPDIPLWIRALIFPLKDSAGKPRRLVFMHENITERKFVEQEIIKAKEQAEESEKKFREMAELLPQIVFETDIQGNLTYINKYAYKMTGYSEQDSIIGKSSLDFYIPEDRERAMQNIKIRYTGEKLIESNEYTMIRKDGSTFNILVYSNPIFKNSKPVGLRGIIVDISELKQTEQELIKAKLQAEESDRLKSSFLANMSHEIRTPMNGILGFSELLKEPDLSGEEQQAYIAIIEKSGRRMLNIINDIVDISKIEAGLMNLDISESNINEQIEYIYTFFKPEVDAKGMKLCFRNSLITKEAIIKTDREKLYAILTNLVKNAIKYSNSGTIEFGYIKRDKSLEFYVKDTGIGIPKDRQEAIFERFIQADISDKMARQGAGLGLAITKSYIEMMGGKIWVESNEGIGSTFYFTLPYSLESGTKTIDPQQITNEKNETTRKLKIIIAEDDEVSEKLIDSYIKIFGKEILKARTGVEVVEQCRSNPDIDLILMDIRMPVMDGYEAIRQIRKFNKEVIIIAQTAYGLTGDRDKSMDSGCNDYIAKPIKKIELQKMIVKYFGS